MKKLLVLTLGLFAFGFGMQAQEVNENAVGLRLGGGEGFGPEITYQRYLYEDNRIEANLGLRNKSDFSSFKIVGLYQWVFPLEDGFNWYVGAGAGLGNVHDSRGKKRHDDGIFALVAGDIGIEYNFEDIPLQLALDFRPEIALANYNVYNSFGPDFGLSIRYRF